MSAYPGFTDGDLERQAKAIKAELRYAKAMGKHATAITHTEELDRIEAEQKRRSR